MSTPANAPSAPPARLALGNCQDALCDAIRHLQGVLTAPTPLRQFQANHDAREWLESIGAL